MKFDDIILKEISQIAIEKRKDEYLVSWNEIAVSLAKKIQSNYEI